MPTGGLLPVMAERISITSFRELFEIDDEFAVIDPRDSASFASGHLLAASSLPLQYLDQLIGPAVPLQQTLCVLVDAGEGQAAQAADILETIGYTNLAILDGGIGAWKADGGEIFSGTSVPGKAFGEFIEKVCSTPSMTAAELHARQKRDAKVLLIDSRTAEEHESYCLPNARLCPGAELVYRVLPLIDDETEVVVHCGGRTRSIIGAQTLIDAGCKRVYALENGTMAWQFEGLELEHGNRLSLAAPDPDSLATIQATAEQMAERWQIDRVHSIAALEQRSRYLVDVRSLEEYEAGHIRGSIHVPGGHLLQNVDRYLVVRNAIVILIDSDRVRAITIAVWLRRMGWRRVYVFSLDDDKTKLDFGSGNAVNSLEDRDLDPADYDDPQELMRANRAYLEWEIELIDQLPGEPAAPYMSE
jgi:rhodanese-related sulfurtransferase